MLLDVLLAMHQLEIKLAQAVYAKLDFMMMEAPQYAPVAITLAPPVLII